MIAGPESLPEDIERLKALVLEGRREIAAKDAELARSQDANTRLWETLRQLQRTQFGRKSEKLDPDQFNFGMEETEQAREQRAYGRTRTVALHLKSRST